MADKLKQKAGENSNQFSANSVDTVNQMQVGTMNMYTGLTVADCINICNQVFLSHAKEYTEEAVETAMQRNQVFSNDVVNRLAIVENALEEFKKPEFQSLLVKAQKTATRTSKMDDYKLLSELVVQKVEKKDEKKIGTGITRAIEVVDEIDTDSLLALTMQCAIIHYTPASGELKKNLSVLEELYKSVLYDILPTNYDWMDQLDVIDCIRIQSTKFKNFYDYLMEKSEGIFCAGIDKSSQDYTMANNLLVSASLPQALLIDNELLPGFVRVPVVNKREIKDIVLDDGETMLNSSQVSTLEKIYDMYSNKNDKKAEMKKKAYELLDTYPTIKLLKEWWKKCPYSFSVTIVGKTLAYSNLCRIDPTLPKIY